MLRVIKRNIFLIGLGSVVLVVVLLVGQQLAKHSSFAVTLSNILSDYKQYFFMLRMTMYLVLYIGWRPWLLWLARRKNIEPNSDMVKHLLDYKNKILIVCVVMELFIIQNIAIKPVLNSLAGPL